MKRRHFELLEPVCPVCRLSGNSDSPLQIKRVDLEANEIIEQGLLICSSPDCQREYPIIDGIPILVSDLQEFLNNQILMYGFRSDLSETLESVIGDCCGPSSTFGQMRQQISSYGWGHWADLCLPRENNLELGAGSTLELLTVLNNLMGEMVSGPRLEIGCAVGRQSFELAKQTSDLVLGVDLNLGMLRIASSLLRTAEATLSIRRTGLVYERRRIRLPEAPPENLDFWACDALALPFRDGQYSQVVALNVLDSVHDPLALLQAIAKVMREGGSAGLSCPYDWSDQVTPVGNWLGGHSQRSLLRGESTAVLEALLAESANCDLVDLAKVAQADNLPWHVRLHDRSTMSYLVHLFVLEKGRNRN